MLDKDNENKHPESWKGILLMGKRPDRYAIHKIKKCLLLITAFIIPFSISLFARKESYRNTFLSQNGTIIDFVQPRNKTIYCFSPSSFTKPLMRVCTGRLNILSLE